MRDVGHSGFQEAVNRKWLIADEDAHALRVNDNGSVLNSIIEQANEDDLGIGDEVLVTDNGESFKGVVARSENGAFEVSFSGGKKPRNVRPFRREEIQFVSKANPANQPGRSQSAPGVQNQRPPVTAASSSLYATR